MLSKSEQLLRLLVLIFNRPGVAGAVLHTASYISIKQVQINLEVQTFRKKKVKAISAHLLHFNLTNLVV